MGWWEMGKRFVRDCRQSTTGPADARATRDYGPRTEDTTASACPSCHTAVIVEPAVTP